ncbi:MAG: hypothetical protein Q4F93_10660 [bacterium]|nr:hypothetical protein [bacterium]
MKTKCFILPLLFLMVSFAIASCSPRKGELRDRNLEQATLARLDSVPGIQYVGKSYARELDDDKFQTVIICYITDSVGNRTEYNARVTTNDDCSEIYSWEELNTHILSDVKQKVTDTMEEKGIDMDGSLIDALIELRKR